MPPHHGSFHICTSPTLVGATDETLPFSNSWDNHGKFIAQITRRDNLELVIGWLHKFIPITKELGFGDVLAPLRIYEIPVVFIVPDNLQKKAHDLLADKAVTYRLADPAVVTSTVFEMLEQKTESRSNTV